MRGRYALGVVVFVLAVVVAAATAGGRSAAAKPGFQLLAHVPLEGPYGGDVYGHRGHAYLGSWHPRDDCASRGVRIYSLADPRQPKLVGRFADAASNPEVRGTWTEKTIVKHVATPTFTGELAVTSFQACRTGSFQGFGLYDVTNPSTPHELALVRTEPRGSHEIWLAGARGHAWVYTAIIRSEIVSSPDYDPNTRNATKPGKPDFRIFDVSNPREPRQVGEWGAWAKLGVHPNRGRGDGAMSANLVHSVITNAAATRAYVSHWDLGTVILDIGDPANPRYLGRTTFVGKETGNAHSSWLAGGEKLLIETRETGNGYPALYDVSKPRTPKRLSTYRLSSKLITQGHRYSGMETVSGLDLTDSVHDAKVRGNTAFFSWYTQGVVAVDIANPRKPRFLARFLPKPQDDADDHICDRTRCVSVWGVYPLGDLILASDLVSGLWVLRFR